MSLIAINKRAAAVRAGLDVDPEYPLEPLSPAHCRLLLGRRAIRFSRRVGGPGAPTSH